MQSLAVLTVTQASCNLFQVAEWLGVLLCAPGVLKSADLRVPPPPPHLQVPLPETLAEETLNVNGVLLRSNEYRASSVCQGYLQQACSRRW